MKKKYSSTGITNTLFSALINSRLDYLNTSLLVAAFPCQVNVAKVLLLAGADAHARDHRSRCPLHMAALSGKGELVSALLACGADPNKASDLGTTALHNAVGTAATAVAFFPTGTTAR